MPTMADAPIDAQDLAFAALLPLAEPTERALSRVQQRLNDEDRLVAPLRERLHVVQRAALNGLSRFSHGVVEIGNEYERIPGLRRSSTAVQEEQNIYLWTLNDQFMLRVKREPIDRVDPGTQRLFNQLPPDDRPVQVFLTWDVSEDGQIISPVFACVEEPKWTISLARLLAATSGSPTAIRHSPRKAVVQSAREEVGSPTRTQADGTSDED
jgi:hypothetical protein